jgi:hypothetical protein
MASAILAIPWFIFTFFLAEKGGAVAKAAEAAMLVAGTALTVYLLVALQRLLHETYGFRDADLPIRLLIKANVVSAAVSLLGLVPIPLGMLTGAVADVMLGTIFFQAAAAAE